MSVLARWFLALLLGWFMKQLFIAIIHPWLARPLEAASKASTRAAQKVGVA